MEYIVAQRIVVLNPPADVNFSLQDDKGNPVSITTATECDMAFDFQSVVKANQRTGAPNFTGPFARGTPSKRFVYVNIGQFAGQEDSPWNRRAKIWLTGYPKSHHPKPRPITWEMVKQVAEDPNKVLMAMYKGTDEQGEPSLDIQLISGGWVIAQK